MNESGALCIRAGRDTCDYSHDARADVRSHSEINALIERYKPRENHCYRNRSHDRRALNDCGEHCANENEQYGIFYKSEKIFDCFHLRKVAHRAAHHIETDEKHAEACEYAADFFDDVFLCKSHDERTDSRKRCKYDARRDCVVKHAERGDLSRYGRSYVCAVNHGCRLHERHNACVDETYDHDAGCARTLNCRGCHRAYADANEFALGRASEEFFEFV